MLKICWIQHLFLNSSTADQLRERNASVLLLSTNKQSQFFIVLLEERNNRELGDCGKCFCGMEGGHLDNLSTPFPSFSIG